MLTTPERAKLERVLEPLLLKTKIASSTLLQAYATFSVLVAVETFPSNPKAAFDHVLKQYSKFSRALLHTIDLNSDLLSNAIRIFTAYSFEDFLRFVLPDVVCDSTRFLNLIRKEYGAAYNILEVCHHLVQIKLVSYTKSTKSTDYVDVIEALFDTYRSLETNDAILFNLSEFAQWYQAINTYPLNTDELSLKPYLGYTERELYNGLDILSKQLQLSRSQQLDAAARLIVDHDSPMKVMQEHLPLNFSIEKDSSIREQLFTKAFSSLLKVPPLDLACVLSTNKLYRKANIKNHTERSIAPNDVTLENGLIYHRFVASLPLASEDKLLFLYPSPYFIRKWTKDTKTRNRHATFVLESKALCNLIKAQFEDDANNIVSNNSTFLSAEDFLKQDTTAHLEYSKVLFFATNISISEQTQWLQFIKAKSSSRSDIFVLMSSYEFEKALSPFSAELDDPHLQITSASLIPQGINNSTRPRRKIFLHCIYDPASLVSSLSLKTHVNTYTLNTDLKTQALSMNPNTYVDIQQNNLTELNKSVRELFRNELLARHASGRSKMAPFSFEITPDILGWCSKSYPKNNAQRPRLEVYVCKPAEVQKRERGYMDRGEMIKGTRKHVTRFSDNEVFVWLEEEYPYSTVQPRNVIKDNTDSPLERKPIISIRDEIIAEYKPRLEGENITLKTLWYLYPYLQDCYSGTDYLMLTHMVRYTEIGQLTVDDLTIEKCDEWLPQIYPNESDSSLWHRVEILNLALNKAVEFGYCTCNRIAPILIDQKVQDKHFRQVRSSLVKKHLTKEEMLRLYAFLKNKIENEGKLEYLGVMIRFLTGLESNIICAFNWGDLRYIPDYGITSFVVTRQVTNDGKTLAPLDAIEDYLQFPCSVLLQTYLSHCRTQVEKELGKWSRFEKVPIVKTRESISSADTRYDHFAPKNLDKLCKEALRNVGINDRIIVLPTTDNGTKETNLNQYSGNFFRENFRYWAINHCKLFNDEVMYLIRNKPETTFGRYYCDFLNDASQFVLYKKLFRLDAFLTIASLQAKNNTLNGKHSLSFNFSNDRSYPVHIHALITSANCPSEIIVTITSSHGVKTYISVLESN